LCKREKYSFSIQSSWSQLVSTRSTVLILLLQLGFPDFFHFLLYWLTKTNQNAHWIQTCFGRLENALLNLTCKCTFILLTKSCKFWYKAQDVFTRTCKFHKANSFYLKKKQTLRLLCIYAFAWIWLTGTKGFKYQRSIGDEVDLFVRWDYTITFQIFALWLCDGLLGANVI
jgi:hypothetical protein